MITFAVIAATGLIAATAQAVAGFGFALLARGFLPELSTSVPFFPNRNDEQLVVWILDSVAGALRAAPGGVFDAPEELRQPDLTVGIEAALEDADLPHAVRAEAPVIVPELAPRCERPGLAPEIESERAHVARRPLPVGSHVVELEHPVLADRPADRGDLPGQLLMAGEGRGEERRVKHHLA